jgi:hypothetical protein
MFHGVQLGSLLRVDEALVSTDPASPCAVCGATAVVFATTRFAHVNLCRPHSGDRPISDAERLHTIARLVAEGRTGDVVHAYWNFAVKRTPSAFEERSDNASQ